MKKTLLVTAIMALNACAFIPQNNDKVIPADTPEDKVVTLIQKDTTIRQGLNTYVTQTDLVIDGEEVKRFYFKKHATAKRYPVPQKVYVRCSPAVKTRYYKSSTHLVEEKLEEGKTSISTKSLLFQRFLVQLHKHFRPKMPFDLPLPKAGGLSKALEIVAVFVH